MSDDYKPPEPSFLMAKVVFPLYDRIVLFYPKWWTPNGITLFGISCTLLASFIALSSIPKEVQFVPAKIQVAGTPYRADIPYNGVIESFVSAIPSVSTDMRIVLAIVGFLNLVYCIADNTDGRQARRLKMSSAIGEYLDHGLDCVTSLLSTFILILVVGLPANVAAGGAAVIACVTMLSHLLNLEHGVMIWGNSAASVDEAMLAFAFAPLIPSFVPGLTTLRVPLLPELKVLDLLWYFFIAAQIHVAYTILSRKKVIAARAPFLVLIGTVVLFSSLVASHTEDFNAKLEAKKAATNVAKKCCCGCWFVGYKWLKTLSYPAVWTIAFATTASILCHIPIVAKCLKNDRMDPWPLALVLFIWLSFMSCPTAGAYVAILSHIAQVIINIVLIKKKAAAAKK